eukprot:TRINITY_DN3970_c0_g1_i1.p1 TRINITY_DN3970_c0_g1~~TRINITY_DN3970_c0_g1_i1.p1  ORF type:complete len:314 (+),score=35.77 TRINITY_DN3970_c0_g1_i1:84-1025(+)
MPKGAGALVEGVWVPGETLAGNSKRTKFSEWMVPEHRYHLYLAMGCPFAHSVRLSYLLKQIPSEYVSISYVEDLRGDEGWEFSSKHPDPINNFQKLHQVYTMNQPDCTTRVSVPVMFDLDDKWVVSNESWNIIELLDDHPKAKSNVKLISSHPDFANLRERITKNINEGVYKARFAKTSMDYENAYASFFEMLDELEARLKNQQYLLGTEISAVDIRLFVTLVRFDIVYHGLFKLNKCYLEKYPALFSLVCRIYALPGVAETAILERIKETYYRSFDGDAIIPKGPDVDFTRDYYRNSSKSEDGPGEPILPRV